MRSGLLVAAACLVSLAALFPACPVPIRWTRRWNGWFTQPIPRLVSRPRRPARTSMAATSPGRRRARSTTRTSRGSSTSTGSRSRLPRSTRHAPPATAVFSWPLQGSFTSIDNRRRLLEKRHAGPGRSEHPKELGTNNGPDSWLQIYNLNLRKGLPFGFELGVNIGYMVHTSIMSGGADIRWACSKDSVPACWGPSGSLHRCRRAHRHRHTRSSSSRSRAATA